MKFEGSYVALITPFKSNGEVDEDKIRELVNYHIENGTAGIVPCGTTGEAPTLTFSEHEKVIKIVVEEVRGRIQVVAGAGSNKVQVQIIPTGQSSLQNMQRNWEQMLPSVHVHIITNQVREEFMNIIRK